MNFFPAECEPGYQLSPLGNCEPCAVGFYRPKGQPACEQCPSGLTTASVGAAAKTLCNLGKFIMFNFFDLIFFVIRNMYYWPLSQRNT